ncbi:hypothetical protein GF407_14845 [candidate division KSB1 bacterium]|nr:hypothetical protein [candidate division KSB1 bacterium]
MLKTGRVITNIVLLLLCGLMIGCSKETRFNEGLVGVYYSNPDLTTPKLFSVVDKLEHRWGKENGFATEWGLEWLGFLIAPTDGKVKIHVETNKQAKLVFGSDVLTIDNSRNKKVITIDMNKNEKIPLEIYYMHYGGGEGYFNVYWSWSAQEKTIIAEPYLVYSDENEKNWIWVKEPNKDKVDKKQFSYVDTQNIIIADEPGYFMGWPANNGIWSWGSEILVGFIKAPFVFDVLHHSYDKKNQTALLGRSLDGGQTWSIEDPDNFATDGGKALPLKESIDYSHPDLAIRHERDRFYYSYNRGKTWQGPFTFTGLDMGELTSRTDYDVVDQGTCLLFLSHIDNRVKANLPDRAFTAKTTDGGKTFNFISWMTETDTVRSVMSSTVRMSEDHLISAMRRRYDPDQSLKPLPQKNWIDVYESFDNGNSWQFLSKVADTDNGTRNGNPPSIVLLQNGGLCVTYGYRGVPYGIRAKISRDKGKTWSKEIILRDDAIDKDVGYTQSVLRPDGKIVTLYYFTTENNTEQHIATTIWDPADVKL